MIYNVDCKNVKDVIACIRNISDDLCEVHLANFSQSLDKLSTPLKSQENSNKNKKGCLHELYTSIPSEIFASLEKGNKILQEHLHILDTRKFEVGKLREQCTALRNKLEEKENHKRALKRKLESYGNESRILDHLRNSIRMYKSSTATRFCFKEGRTTGYMKSQTSGNFEVFDYDNSAHSATEISKMLWGTLDKAIM